MNKNHLINVLAEYQYCSYEEAKKNLETGEADLRELLNAYLYDEGILGYTDEIMEIIRIFENEKYN